MSSGGEIFDFVIDLFIHTHQQVLMGLHAPLRGVNVKSLPPSLLSFCCVVSIGRLFQVAASLISRFLINEVSASFSTKAPTTTTLQRHDHTGHF